VTIFCELRICLKRCMARPRRRKGSCEFSTLMLSQRPVSCFCTMASANICFPTFASQCVKRGICHFERTLAAGWPKVRCARWPQWVDATHALKRTVGVLVCAALPWAVWSTQKRIDIRRQGERLMPRHLRSAVPGQRAVQLFW